MKVLGILLTLCASVMASRLLSSDDLQNLFVRLYKNELSQSEIGTLKNVLDMYSFDLPSDNPLERNSRLGVNCFLCRNLLSGVFGRLPDSNENVIESLNGICVSLAIASPRVCRGAIELNLPIITYILANTPEVTPRTICSLLLQTPDNRNVCSITDPRFHWTIDLPEPIERKDVQVPKTQSKPLTVAILTDSHVDPYYEPYGVADCSEPICCRKGQTPRERSNTTRMDETDKMRSVVQVNDNVMLDLDVLESVKRVPLENEASGASEPAGYWGDYRHCDSPVWAYDDVIERISEAHKDVDIIYYVGDNIDHHVWETTYEMVNITNNYVINKMRKTFGDDVLIVPVIGNHESQPTNQFAPSSITGEYLNTTWLYEALANKWDFYLTEEAKETVRQRGQFSMLIRPGLRVISLNNNVAYRYNWWVVYDPTDAKIHLEWLVDELYKAESAGEKVHILTHISPGMYDLTETWTREYNKVVNRFASTIAAEFNGHVHSDEFKIFYDSSGVPTSIAWGAGSATAYSNYNLNYKIATFDPTTFEPTNIVNYIYNLTEANLTPHLRPNWFPLYDFKSRFALQDLSPQSLDNLVYSMVTDKKHLLDLYSAFHSKLSDTRWPLCKEDCKLAHLCEAVVTVLWQKQKCNELRRLFFSS